MAVSVVEDMRAWDHIREHAVLPTPASREQEALGIRSEADRQREVTHVVGLHGVRPGVRENSKPECWEDTERTVSLRIVK